MSALLPIDQLHIERSLCIDAFAATEQAIAALLLRVGLQAGADMAGQKIERLRAAKAGPQFSKAKRAEVHALLDELERLLPVRNDLVHAPIRLARIDGETFATFLNPRDMDCCGNVARLMTSAQLTRLRSDLDRILVGLRL